MINVTDTHSEIFLPGDDAPEAVYAAGDSDEGNGAVYLYITEALGGPQYYMRRVIGGDVTIFRLQENETCRTVEALAASEPELSVFSVVALMLANEGN